MFLSFLYADLDFMPAIASVRFPLANEVASFLMASLFFFSFSSLLMKSSVEETTLALVD
jgi:hypothetical protein